MRRPLILAGLLSLGACGFQLRGQTALPEVMQRTHVAAPESSAALVRELERLLRASDIELTAGSDADAILEITTDHMRRTVQSVGATARAREFAVEYTVAFRVSGPGGDVLHPLQTVELRRDYTFDERQVLGTANEEELIREELRRAMAGRILAALAGR